MRLVKVTNIVIMQLIIGDDGGDLVQKALLSYNQVIEIDK